MRTCPGYSERGALGADSRCPGPDASDEPDRSPNRRGVLVGRRSVLREGALAVHGELGEHGERFAGFDQLE
jgi:hypothetical protein